MCYARLELLGDDISEGILGYVSEYQKHGFLPHYLVPLPTFSLIPLFGNSHDIIFSYGSQFHRSLQHHEYQLL